LELLEFEFEFLSATANNQPKFFNFAVIEQEYLVELLIDDVSIAGAV